MTASGSCVHFAACSIQRRCLTSTASIRLSGTRTGAGALWWVAMRGLMMLPLRARMCRLALVRNLEIVRIIICGGDGTAGWVMQAADRTGISQKCHIGMLPLGTGNDLARVFGWGASVRLHDDESVSRIIDEFEHSHVAILDRCVCARVSDHGRIGRRDNAAEPLVAFNGQHTILRHRRPEMSRFRAPCPMPRARRVCRSATPPAPALPPSQSQRCDARRAACLALVC